MYFLYFYSFNPPPSPPPKYYISFHPLSKPPIPLPPPPPPPNACRLIASTSVCHPCRCYFVCSFKMQNRKQLKNTRKCANTEIGQQLEIIVIKMLSITHRQSPYSSHVTRPSPNISTCNSFCNLNFQISTNCKQKQIKTKKNKTHHKNQNKKRCSSNIKTMCVYVFACCTWYGL